MKEAWWKNEAASEVNADENSAKKEKVTLEETATSTLVMLTTKFGLNDIDYSQGYLEDVSKGELRNKSGQKKTWRHYPLQGCWCIPKKKNDNERSKPQNGYY